MKKDLIKFDDFAKLDIRVGEVIDAKEVEESEKLIELTVDLGEDYGTKTIFAGIKKWYPADKLKGTKMLFLANLEPKKMMDSYSQGMMLAVDEEGKPLLVTLDKSYNNGLIVK